VRLWPFGRKSEKRNISRTDLWGSGEDIAQIRGDSIHTALSLIPVFAATRLIADSVASLPLETYKQTKGVIIRTDDPSLLKNPTAYGTVYDWVHRAVTSLALRGNAYGLILERDKTGNPTLIEWQHPDFVSLEMDDTRFKPVWFVNGKRLDNNEDLVHIPGYTLPGKVLGVSPIKAAQLTIETGIQAQRFGHDWLANGATPSAVLETEDAVTWDQAQDIKRKFKQAAKGREPVALGLGISYKPISVPAEESQFLATLRATNTDIANIYGIPAELIGGDTNKSMTYSTTEQEQIKLVLYALRPYLVKIELALSRLFPNRICFKFNVDAVLRADTKTRYESYALALTNRWMNVDEVRALEDLPPLPDGKGKEYGQPVPELATPAPPEPAALPPGGTPNSE